MSALSLHIESTESMIGGGFMQKSLIIRGLSAAVNEKVVMSHLQIITRYLYSLCVLRKSFPLK